MPGAARCGQLTSKYRSVSRLLNFRLSGSLDLSADSSEELTALPSLMAEAGENRVFRVAPLKQAMDGLFNYLLDWQGFEPLSAGTVSAFSPRSGGSVGAAPSTDNRVPLEP